MRRVRASNGSRDRSRQAGRSDEQRPGPEGETGARKHVEVRVAFGIAHQRARPGGKRGSERRIQCRTRAAAAQGRKVDVGCGQPGMREQSSKIAGTLLVPHVQPRVAHDPPLGGKGGREQHGPFAGNRAAGAGKLGGDMSAQRGIDLLEQDPGAPCGTSRKCSSHDGACGPFSPGTRVEIKRHDRAARRHARVERDRDVPGAAEEGRGAVGGAGEVVSEDQDAGQRLEELPG